MAGAAYFRTRTLLREQAVIQSENLLINQLKVVDQEIAARENKLERQISSEDARVLIEIALHANPQSDDFREIRSEFIASLQNSAPEFNQFLLIDTDGTVKVASNAEWQGETIVLDDFDLEEHRSIALYGLPPLYENEFILISAIDYQTARGSTLGTVIGITEKAGVWQLLQPINGLAPYASTFFILADNKLIASNPANGEFTLVSSTSASQDELISSLAGMAQGEEQSPVALDVLAPNGEPAIAQLQYFPGMQSGVVLEVDANDIYGRVNSLAPFTILLALATLAATGLVLMLGARRVIKPIQALSDITRKFADGDWSQRARVASNDEVGLLANSFNQMADQLSEMYQSLERKVDERARQLRDRRRGGAKHHHHP
ncbi:MAG: HAMP domain-containing protein [Chloroflexi bacterium]|nr:HAMP domain-containing protein [Chloroflexota bacterium]